MASSRADIPISDLELLQEFDEFIELLNNGQIERCHARMGEAVFVGAVLKKGIYDGWTPMVHCIMERCPAIDVRAIYKGSLSKKGVPDLEGRR